jgi:regulator of RNase E activity RraA
MYSRGRFMRTGKDRVQVAEVGGAVTLGDVRVAPGDLVVGDDDGVVVVPQDRAEEVAATALRISEAEDLIIAAVRQGMTIAEARRQHGYHSLQRPEEDS